MMEQADRESVPAGAPSDLDLISNHDTDFKFAPVHDAVLLG